ncbi:methyltransferase, FxLD system [Catellatospora bangladeshensis]|uniref:Protein-L-isoaspartate O-methyltransferase n=1 Tax=Catellatospora bangladeshensis TaxID=310355 RepID=A0A8J3JYI5_9ACTN|nr:methyltransferase, FxLD system [Catellatospora bangladeshensis]GIF86029.1 O-methyltransferase [Catellatospora bangladeshensis]
MTSEFGTTWRQLNVCCADWQHAEQAGILLGPVLDTAQMEGQINSWWFVRKRQCWRVRLHSADTDPLPVAVTDLVEQLRTTGTVQRADEVIYEPEVHAFGGPNGMTLAHHLFHQDSSQTLTYLATAGSPRRLELGLRLAMRLMRAAELEWYEQGDVWARIAAHRQTPATRPSTRTVQRIAHLITARHETDRSPLHAQPAWPAAFDDAGTQLAAMAAGGQLTRGLRDLLTHHLLFAWNRLGIPAAEQHLAADTARALVFDYPPHALARILDPRPDPDKVTPMPTATTNADQLRNQLADTIAARGTFKTPTVEAAFRTVPRHQFLPDVPLADAYAPRPVVTRRAADGQSLSSASSPNLVAEMLEQAGLLPGHRVLEIGAATGINAALIREIVGDTGRVVTIEYDPELADGARDALARAGYTDVTVIAGDGAHGAPDHGPYDRIIVTAGAWTIADAWWQQLTPDGRIIVPLRLHESGLTRCLALDRTTADHLTSTTKPLVCGFVPMRGLDEHDDHHVVLHGDLAIRLDSADNPDRGALATAMDHPRQESWTGIQVGDHDPIGHLDLWLLTHTDKPFGRLSVGPNAKAAQLATPAYRWAGAAIYDGGTIAYIAFRNTGPDVEELGVIAHGPAAQTVATAMIAMLQQWDGAGRPDTPTVDVHHGTASRTAAVFTRQNCLISVAF